MNKGPDSTPVRDADDQEHVVERTLLLVIAERARLTSGAAAQRRFCNDSVPGGVTPERGNTPCGVNISGFGLIPYT